VIIDCDSCQVRGLACSDCVVSVLQAPPGRIDDDQREAIETLSEAGMVPPLRLAVVSELSESNRDMTGSSRYGGSRNAETDGSKGLPRVRSAG